MHCHFHNPVSIHSGPGMRRQIGALAAKYGKKALIVTTGSAHSRALAEEAGASLEAAGLGWAHYNGIRPNPLAPWRPRVLSGPRQLVRHGHRDRRRQRHGRKQGHRLRLLQRRADLRIHLRAQTGRAGPAILLIATTAGTGSEGNWTAVFTDTDHVKKGFALPALYPKESIVDPELMTTLSSRGIAGPRLRRAGPRIESFLSVRANPFSKLYSRQAILWLSEGLPKVQASPSDLETWERVALGSTFSGIAIGNAAVPPRTASNIRSAACSTSRTAKGLPPFTRNTCGSCAPTRKRILPSWPGFWARRLPALRKRKPRCAPSSRWTPF